jgi:hypothetical protein
MMSHAKRIADRGASDETGIAIGRLRETVVAAVQ